MLPDAKCNWHSRRREQQPLPALLTLSFQLTFNVTMMFGQLMFLLSVVGGHSPKIKCREDVKSSGIDQIDKMYLLKDSDVKAQVLN